jgi:hypothetical protein
MQKLGISRSNHDSFSTQQNNHNMETDLPVD